MTPYSHRSPLPEKESPPMLLAMPPALSDSCACLFERRALNNMAMENRKLAVGTKLWANYKKQRHVCSVEAGEEEGSLVYVLADGTKHKSPSAAGSKVMGGKAVNGWRFWTVEGGEPAATEKPKAEKKSKDGKKKSQKTFFKTPSQANAQEGKTSYFCSACMKAFVHDSTDEPEACPEGHRNDDAELNAPAGVTSAEEAEVTG